MYAITILSVINNRVFAFCILKLFSVENSVEKSVISVVNSVTKKPEKRVYVTFGMKVFFSEISILISTKALSRHIIFP